MSNDIRSQIEKLLTEKARWLVAPNTEHPPQSSSMSQGIAPCRAAPVHRPESRALPRADSVKASAPAQIAILVFTNLGVNTIDGSSIFITNWLNMLCLLKVNLHFLSTIEPGEHFRSRLSDVDRVRFHTCDPSRVVAELSRLDATYRYDRIFIRSWGPKLLWFAESYAGKVCFYWPLTGDPSDEDRMVYGAVGSVIFQTADLREATSKVFGPRDSMILQPIIAVSSCRPAGDMPRCDLRRGVTFGYVGTLRPECYSRELLQAMVDILTEEREASFYLVIGKIHYVDFAEKKAVLDLVAKIRTLPNAKVYERLDKLACDAILARCDVSYSLWERTPSNELQVSTKLLESLSIGCQVITFDTDRHRRLLGMDYPGLINAPSDIRSASLHYVKNAGQRIPRFSDQHMLSQFAVERQSINVASHVGFPLAAPRECARRLFNKQYDEVYGVYINDDEELKLQTLERRHGIKIRLFPGTHGREELVEEFAEYQKHGLRTDWERSAKRQRLTIGAMGHLYTFIRIAEDALARGYRKILVLEADVILHREFFERHVGLELEDYKLLYLGAGMWRSDVEFTSDRRFYHPKQTTGTFAVSFDRSILEECVDLWRQLVDPTDVVLWKIQEKHRAACFVVSPNLAICDLSRSNTSQTRDQKKLSQRFCWNLAEYDVSLVEHVGRYVEHLCLHIAHVESGARIKLVGPSGARDIPCDRSFIEIPVNDHVSRVEYENVFIARIEFRSRE